MFCVHLDIKHRALNQLLSQSVLNERLQHIPLRPNCKIIPYNNNNTNEPYITKCCDDRTKKQRKKLINTQKIAAILTNRVNEFIKATGTSGNLLRPLRETRGGFQSNYISASLRFYSDATLLRQGGLKQAPLSDSNNPSKPSDSSKPIESFKPSPLTNDFSNPDAYRSMKSSFIEKPSGLNKETTLSEHHKITKLSESTETSKSTDFTASNDSSVSSEDSKSPFTRNLCSSGCACCPPCSTRDCLFCTVYNRCCADNSRKVTVVGAGNVGLAATICMLMQETTNNIALIDADTHKLTGEVMDFMHGADYVNYNVCGGSDFSTTADSKVCVIATGTAQRKDESASEVIQRNVDILKKVIPPLIRYSPSTILLVVTNPLDILVYAAWRISGLPRNRVIGTGTLLDSARFRYFVSQRLRVAPTSIQAYVIGVHGPLLVPVWSNLNVCGSRLCEFNPCIGTECDPEKWIEIYTDLVYAPRNVKKYKKYTSTAVAMATNKVVRSILTDSNEVYCLSTYVRGQQCVCEEVFLSLPCCICAEGVREIVRLNLSYTEWDAFVKSAKSICELQSKITW